MKFIAIGDGPEYSFLVNIEMIFCVEANESLESARPFIIKIHTKHKEIVVGYHSSYERDENLKRIGKALGFKNEKGDWP